MIRARVLQLVAVACALSAVPSVAREQGTYSYAPRLVKAVQPKYPKAALQSRVEGTVLVEFTVDERGRTRDLVVLRSVSGLDQAALAAVREWRFQPARRHEQAVRARVTAPIAFKAGGVSSYVTQPVIY